MFLKIFQKMNLFIYKTLGSTVSVRLAISPIGKIFFSLMFKGKDKSIYTTSEGIKLELDSIGAMYSGIGLLGTYSPFETVALKSILNSGDVVIDVGAYMGYYSLLAGKLIGDKGKVFSFEPSPVHFDSLNKNILRNKLDNIKTFNLAVSNKKGVVSFYEAGSGSSLIKKEAETHIGRKIKPIRVKAVTLNDFTKKEKIKHIDFIKIDVEGWDLQVLKGASDLLKVKDAPDVMVEVFDTVLKRGGFSANEVLAYMKSFDYIAYAFTNNGLQLFKDEKDTRTLNLLFRKRFHNLSN